MALNLTVSEQIARARSDLRMGAIVVLTSQTGAALVQAAEMVAPARLNDLRELGRPELVLTRWRAETLRARAYDGDIARLEIPDGADCTWVRATADPVHDLTHPMKGPYHTARNGDADLHRAAIQLCKQAHLLPAALVLTHQNAKVIALKHHLTLLDITPLSKADITLHHVSAGKLPISVSPDAQLRVFRPSDGGEEHYLVEIGVLDRAKPVLTRLHSACFTGDVIGSLKCDCGEQLAVSLHQIGKEGAGVLLYLNQEGRGIGLANKMRAYALQTQGFDTVEANHRLGFEDDERDFQIGAEMLKATGVTSIRLMTNNPAKVSRMRSSGISVSDRVPLIVKKRPENADYLATKAAKSGHKL